MSSYFRFSLILSLFSLLPPPPSSFRHPISIPLMCRIQCHDKGASVRACVYVYGMRWQVNHLLVLVRHKGLLHMKKTIPSNILLFIVHACRQRACYSHIHGCATRASVRAYGCEWVCVWIILICIFDTNINERCTFLFWSVKSWRSNCAHQRQQHIIFIRTLLENKIILIRSCVRGGHGNICAFQPIR